MRAADGLAVRVTAEQQFTPGEGGKAKLQVFKDRYGGVRKYYPSDGKPVLGTFELTSEGEALSYAFHSAQSVRKKAGREYDERQLELDVIALRDAFDERPSVRNAQKALRCNNERARRAANAFDQFAPSEAVA